ncbi:hypothetical protein E1281_03030 [Actinomadura sp. KC345]|uniref:hypothetical protein n=1 Tax=Actinomadura sp. KC345 TaxID=2530371 RepID=UPI00104FEDE2|nr:hypothetical protein [Actinomadura sp. KC345]TDC58025.1 hypothetical protein E1281_03030 [Actinomadura sp. KC345]
MDAVANHFRVGVDDDLVIRWSTPLPDGELVILRHRASGETREEPVRGDRTSLTLPLDGIATGRWDVLTGAGGAYGRSSDRPLLTDDPGFSYDEARTYAGIRRDRAVRVVRSPEGQVSLRVRKVSPHAEVEAVYPGDGEIRVTGRLAYTGPRPGQDARLVAVARDTRDTLTRDLRLDGMEFQVCLPVEVFAAEEPALWDLWLDVADVHARLATRLDDAPGKRGKVSFPRQTTEAGGRQMSVRPYYTLKDELSVAAHLLNGEAA